MNLKKIFSVNRFLGLEDQSDVIKSVFNRFLLFVLIENLVSGIASTFFILYVIDSVGFKQASIITSIILLVKLITDYPSGSLSDKIGQGKVMALSYLFYAIATFVLSFSDNFEMFVIVAIFLGLAYAQSSGTIFSWLDNNYQSLSNDLDSERKIYGYAKVRARMIYRTELGLVVLLGGFLSNYFSRIFVFRLESILAFIAIFLSMILLNNFYFTSIKEDQDDVSLFNHFKGGLSFFVSSKKVFLFLSGQSFYYSGWQIWLAIILFPFYFGYTGSDQVASILRSLIFFGGSIVVVVTAKLSKKFAKKDIGKIQSVYLVSQLLGIIIIMLLIEPTNTFNSLAFILVILLFNSTMVFSVIINSLEDRILVDMVPSENRNSVYSLMPTFSAFLAILFIPITGRLINKYNFVIGVAVVFVVCLLGTLMIFLSTTIKDGKQPITKTKKKLGIPS
ncbi:MAG: hypothetical protein HeimC2_15360 [Candidatus Heimdallarchaeota archaeon LC_2]|nr:MAG: hypothetical protein HeimC2_15360 [Candidatus Heimdallarchaeota archaeon LC_2]